MSRKSKIDSLGIGDQVLLWAVTMDTRTIARKFKETTGTTLSHVSIVKWLQKQREPAQERSLERQESITKVTKELLEGEWADILYEIKRAYRETESEVEKTKLRYQWQKHIEMILKLYRPPDTQITVDARQGPTGESLREQLWKALSE